MEEKLANEFSKLLHEQLGPVKMHTVIQRNKRYPASCCATHDFIDSNMTMFEAFCNTGICTDVDEIIQLYDVQWNRAWNRAKQNQFRAV